MDILQPAHPDWIAKVDKDGSLTLSVKVRLTDKTGLTARAAIRDLPTLGKILTAELFGAVQVLTRAPEKTWFDLDAR